MHTYVIDNSFLRDQSIIDKKLQNTSFEVFKNKVKHVCLQQENVHVYF